jgi:hypothetical protein
MQRASGDEYDEAYERKAAAGENVHGEADFVMRFPHRACSTPGAAPGGSRESSRGEAWM